MTDTYNIVRIEAFTHKKHLIHPALESLDAAKPILKDMARALKDQGHEVIELELAFSPTESQDLYRVEEAKYFRG